MADLPLGPSPHGPDDGAGARPSARAVPPGPGSAPALPSPIHIRSQVRFSLTSPIFSLYQIRNLKHKTGPGRDEVLLLFREPHTNFEPRNKMLRSEIRGINLSWSNSNGCCETGPRSRRAQPRQIIVLGLALWLQCSVFRVTEREGMGDGRHWLRDFAPCSSTSSRQFPTLNPYPALGLRLHGAKRACAVRQSVGEITLVERRTNCPQAKGAVRVSSGPEGPVERCSRPVDPHFRD